MSIGWYWQEREDSNLRPAVLETLGSLVPSRRYLSVDNTTRPHIQPGDASGMLYACCSRVSVTNTPGFS